MVDDWLAAIGPTLLAVAICRCLRFGQYGFVAMPQAFWSYRGFGNCNRAIVESSGMNGAPFRIKLRPHISGAPIIG